MRIDVTRDDIQQGQRQNPKGCPVGRALDRAGVSHCGVTGLAVIMKDNRNIATALLLPEVVQNWIADFHQGKSVEPIAFDLGRPVPATCGCVRKNGVKRNGSSEGLGRPAATNGTCPVCGTSSVTGSGFAE
jgi:hypothetical protein